GRTLRGVPGGAITFCDMVAMTWFRVTLWWVALSWIALWWVALSWIASRPWITRPRMALAHYYARRYRLKGPASRRDGRLLQEIVGFDVLYGDLDWERDGGQTLTGFRFRIASPHALREFSRRVFELGGAPSVPRLFSVLRRSFYPLNCVREAPSFELGSGGLQGPLDVIGVGRADRDLGTHVSDCQNVPKESRIWR